MKKLSVLVLMLLLLSVSQSPAEEVFQKHSARSDKLDREIVYWVYAPGEITDDTPLVVFLHGGGELGDGALNAAMPSSMINGTLTDVAAVLIIPQMPWHVEYWEMLDDAIERMEQSVMEQYAFTPGSMALCGFSMGGIGTMDIANRHPGKYARVLVAAGRVREQVKAGNFAGSEVQFYVGKRDHDINSATVYQYEGYLRWAGVKVKVTEVDADHLGTQAYVFTDRDILDWLFSAPDKGPEETVLSQDNLSSHEPQP